MKMVPYDTEKLHHYKPTKNYRLFEEFLNGDADCVQLVDHGHTSAKKLPVISYGLVAVVRDQRRESRYPWRGRISGEDETVN